ncbi:MAG TPA: cytochrome P450 [Polyangiaceae bacterium]|nr:cytochrome P450 [Polyangiaceae bacterium]
MTSSAIETTNTTLRAPRTMPGPRGRLLSGSLYEAWDNPLELFTRGTREHGEHVCFRFAWLEYYLLSDAAAAHRVLIENAKGYVKSPNYQGLKVMLGQGLLTSEGDYWKRQRKLAQPAFHREKLPGFARSMTRATEDMLARWDRELGDAPFDLHKEMMRLTFRIVGLTLLGTDLEADSAEFGASLDVAIKWANQYVESIVRVPPWVPTPKNVAFRRAQRRIEGVVARVIAERRASGHDGDDLLGMLMGTRDEITGEGMTDRQLMDELLTLTLAGHETTANALTFTFYLLSRHPDVRRKVEAEVRTALEGRVPTLGDLPRMPYVKAVIEESMRLFPPAWVVERMSLEEDSVGGFHLPKGAIVGVSPFVMHRNPRYWKNPEGFDPDRFATKDGAPADGAGKAAEQRPKLAYMPFGAGPRTCIGNAFSMMEMQLIVPMIVQRSALDLVPGFELELDASITLRPKHGVTVARS